MNLHLSHELKI
uniref:Uncharacterized protein n=1 Tax=Rhizophora mucronata TaxID=61149 RepID=A0A2P2P8G0_RHIMU